MNNPKIAPHLTSDGRSYNKGMGHQALALSWSIMLLLGSPALSQTDSTSSGTKENPPICRTQGSLSPTMRNDGLAALNAMAHVVTAPARWEGGDWLTFGAVLGGTGLSALLDNEGHDLMERNRSPFNSHVTKVAMEFGSGYLAVGLPATLYLSGLLFEEKWIRETAVIMGSTVLLTTAMTTAGKIVIGRARPYAGFGNHEFRPFNNRSGFVSFPSGHTTVAFAISAVLAARIKNPWASMGLYCAATATAVSRMYTEDHWLSDVVFTAAYTTAVAHSIVTWFDTDEQFREAHAFSIIPTSEGITVVWRF